MQESFGFAADDLDFIRQSLTRAFGVLAPLKRADPVWKLVRSLIGCRTYDIVAEPALERLKQRWPHPSALARAAPADVERVIQEVTYSKDKAENLVATLQWLGRERPDYDLSFLKSWPVYQALAWLERFPGVGPKVAAATLNASTLRMRVFIVDSHVHRVLIRFGFIGRTATAEDGRNAVTGATTSFDADDLLQLFAQMKRLGQAFCHAAQAECDACPLNSRCRKVNWLPNPTRTLRATSGNVRRGGKLHPLGQHAVANEGYSFPEVAHVC